MRTTAAEIVGYACGYLGLHEKPGAKHEPAIVRMLQAVGPWWRNDETPWCSAYAAEVLGLKCGFDVSTITAAAITWENWGEPVSRNEIRPGDLMIRRRHSNPRSRARHVVIVVATQYVGLNRIMAIGGNQKNRVSMNKIRPPVDAVFRRAITSKEQRNV